MPSQVYEGGSMKSIANLGNTLAAHPVLADDLVELHAARLLLLFRVCGKKDQIEGLTKLAKLDFFVRYPTFFNQISAHLGSAISAQIKTRESGMVRFHYGPWDKRYYQVLAYLEGRNLVTVSKDGSTFVFGLTEKGVELADRLRGTAHFDELVAQMKVVKKLLGSKSGSAIKALIYKVFEKEVSDKAMGETIS
jgi:DNA-binding PadR family transcriptional regulator